MQKRNIIVNEAPMAPRYALEVPDRTLRDIMDPDKPFGGKVIVLGGDFRQLLPVQPRATRSETVNLSTKYSRLWSYFSRYALTENMRVLPNDVEFANFLLDVGNGLLNDPDDNFLIPDRCLAAANRDIVEDIYRQLIHEKRLRKWQNVPFYLHETSMLKKSIQRLWICLTKELSGYLYTSVDSTENCGDNDRMNEMILPEHFNTLSPPSLPVHALRLKSLMTSASLKNYLKFSITMLIRNLSINERLCNGTRLLVLELGNTILRCQILSGDKSGEIVFLHRITLYYENEYPFTFKRRQFPIKIAFAMMINKSQGQTFEKISTDLRKDVFNHGQLYVAFSRVRSWEALKVYLEGDRQGNIFKNYVYKEL